MIFKKKNKFDIYAEEYVGDSSPEIKR